MPPPKPHPPPPSLAIIGGGLGGLVLACALLLPPSSTPSTRPLNPHPTVTIYESAPSFTELGAGVGLGPNALRAMAMLHPAILAGYRRCETSAEIEEEERVRFFNFRWGVEGGGGGGGGRVNGGADGGTAEREGGGMHFGDLIVEVTNPAGQRSSSVHRFRFLSELVALLPDGVARFGKKVVDIAALPASCPDGGQDSGGVVLKFADGTEARHDAVIGCDGIRSRVRQILLGETAREARPVFSGKVCYRGLVPMGEARRVLGEEMAGGSQMYLGPGAHVLTTPIEQGKLVNVVAYCTKQDGGWDEDTPWIVPGTRDALLNRFEGWGKPVRDLLALIKNPDIWALFDHLPAPTYHRGGEICLLGDAAHASTPHHGAGAGMAVEDALVLSRLLAEVERGDGRGMERVFEAYDRVRRPRSQRLVRSSREVAQVYDFEDEVVGGEEGRLKEYLGGAWDRIWEVDLKGEVEKALGILRGGEGVRDAMTNGANSGVAERMTERTTEELRSSL